MIKALQLLFLLLGSNIAQAQFANKHAIYMSGGLGLGNYQSIGGSLNYLYKEKYSLGLGRLLNTRNAGSVPQDFSSSLYWGIFESKIPQDQIESSYLSVGKVYSIGKSQKIRINASFGIAYTYRKQPENWTPANGKVKPASNYTWDDKESYAIGFIINPKLEFPLTRYYGLALSPLLQISPAGNYYGLRIEQMVGLLRKRKE